MVGAAECTASAGVAPRRQSVLARAQQAPPPARASARRLRRGSDSRFVNCGHRRSRARATPPAMHSWAQRPSDCSTERRRDEPAAPPGRSMRTELGPPPQRTSHGGASPLTPDFARGVDDEAELGLFLFDRQRVAVDGRREAALRAEAELIERLEFRHLVDPALQPTFSQVPVRCRAKIAPRGILGNQVIAR